MTWYAHRSNIERLLCGRESKVSLIKSTKKKIKEAKKENILAMQKSAVAELPSAQENKEESENTAVKSDQVTDN